MSFSIDDLIDDCLLLIFYQLSLGDRIKSRLTCNRWATLMPFDDIDSLDVNRLPFAEKQFLPANPQLYLASDKAKIRRSSILRALDFILPRIGANLKSIMFGRTTDDLGCGAIQLLNNYHFDLLINHCPNLEKLEIDSNANLNHMDFAKLAIQLSQKTSLHTMFVCDDRLTDLQKDHFATAFGDQTWPYLTDLTANFTYLGVMVAPQLQNLTLANMDNFTLSKWCEAHPNLSSLTLAGMDISHLFQFNAITNFSPIARLKHLTTLSLACNQLNDADLNLICSSCCKLVRVNLNLTRVTRFDCLQRLHCLTALRILVAENFNESDMLAIVRSGNLKSVNFADMSILTTTPQVRTVFNVTSLVNFNPNLEVLKIGALIPNEQAIVTALEVCKQLRSLVLYQIAVSSDVFAAVGSCKKLSNFKLGSAVPAEHYRCLLDARQQNGLRDRLKVVVGGFSWRQTDEITFLKEELKKVNIFVSHGF